MVTYTNFIKVLLNVISGSTFLLTELFHYGIVGLMVHWMLILLILLKVALINFGITKPFCRTRKLTLLELETDVYVCSLSKRF